METCKSSLCTVFNEVKKKKKVKSLTESEDGARGIEGLWKKNV